MHLTDELDGLREYALGLPRVVGIGHDEDAIVVLTREPTPGSVDAVAEQTAVPVREEVIGDVASTATVPEWRTGGPFMGGCNIAFPAHMNGDAYVVSAYHCTHGLGPGDTVHAFEEDGSKRVVGEITHIPEMVDSPISGVATDVDGDWVAIRVDNAQPIRDIERVDKTLFGGPYDPSVGERVTKEGDRTGISRGSVFVKDTSVIAPANISGYDETVRVDHLTGVNTTVSPGDSGGPVMREMQDHYRPCGTVYGGTPYSSLFYTDMGHVNELTGLNFSGTIPQVQDGGSGEILGGEEPKTPTGEAGPPLLVLAGLGAGGLLLLGIIGGVETPEWAGE